jgi:hypothetical protein
MPCRPTWLEHAPMPLPAASTTVEPARFAIWRCAGGGIILSSVATRYQLGLAFQAGSVTEPDRAPTPHGT